MFGKKELLENLTQDLDRAREKRDALVSKRDALATDVTTLTEQIAEMEARVSEEKDRRERERIVGEVEEIKKRLKDTTAAFAPAIAELCDATKIAAAVVPEAGDLNGLLKSVATEVDAATTSLLRELDQQAETVRASCTASSHGLPSVFPSNNFEPTIVTSG